MAKKEISENTEKKTAKKSEAKETKIIRESVDVTTLENKVKNLTYIVLIGFLIMLILLIGLYFKDGDTTVNKSNTTTSNSSGTSGGTTTSGSGSTNNEDYDVSKMNEVDVKGALDLFKDKKAHVLYIGRSTCGSCVKTVPVLNQVQEELGYSTNYLELEVTSDKSWSNWQSELKELTDKFTVTTTANGEEGNLGTLFYEKGYTPTVVIIKDGKAVDGFIGYRSYDKLKEIVSKYM